MTSSETLRTMRYRLSIRARQRRRDSIIVALWAALWFVSTSAILAGVWLDAAQGFVK